MPRSRIRVCPTNRRPSGDTAGVNQTTAHALADGYAERLHPHEPFVLVPGAVVDLAGEVTFQYELRP